MLEGRPCSQAETSGRTGDPNEASAILDYPTPVKRVTRQVRQHIRERVNQLCGLTIVDLDIRVVALHVRSGPIRRVI